MKYAIRLGSVKEDVFCFANIHIGGDYEKEAHVSVASRHYINTHIQLELHSIKLFFRPSASLAS